MQEKLRGILGRITHALDVQECSEISIYYNIFFLLSKYFGSSWKTTVRGRMTVRKSVLFFCCCCFLNINKLSPNVNVVSMCSHNLASWEIYGFFSEVKSNYAYLYKKKNVPPNFFLWGEVLKYAISGKPAASAENVNRENFTLMNKFICH